MNVEFPKIMSNLKLGEVGARQADNMDKITENAAKQLFSDSLTIKESENFALGDIGEMDMGKDENSLPLVKKVIDFAKTENAEYMVICAKTEEELSILIHPVIKTGCLCFQNAFHLFDSSVVLQACTCQR